MFSQHGWYTEGAIQEYLGTYMFHLAHSPHSPPSLLLFSFFQFQYDNENKRNFGEKMLLRGIGCGEICPLAPEEDSTPEEREAEIIRFVDDGLKWAASYMNKMSGTCYDIATKWSNAVMNAHQV